MQGAPWRRAIQPNKPIPRKACPTGDLASATPRPLRGDRRALRDRKDGDLTWVSPKAPTWGYSFSVSAAPWSSWLLFTPLVVYLARRYPLEGAKRKRSLLVHVGAAIAIAPLQAYVNIYIGVVISILAEGYQTTWRELLFIPAAVIASRCIRNPLIYAIIVGITLTVDYYRKFRDAS